MKNFCGLRVVPKSVSELIGEVPGRGYHMASNLVLRDPRLSPEAKLLFLHIERTLRAGGNLSGRIRHNYLAGLQGVTKRTVCRTLAKITEGAEVCELPLVQLGGSEVEVRTIRLLPLNDIYGGPELSLEAKQRTTWPRDCSFETMHGSFIASYGFTPIPNAILADTRLKPAARIMFSLILGQLSVAPGDEVEISLSDLGRSMGIGDRASLRKILASFDSFEGGKEVIVSLIRSSRVEGIGRSFRLLDLKAAYPEKIVASGVIDELGIVGDRHKPTGSPWDKVYPQEENSAPLIPVNPLRVDVNQSGRAVKASTAGGQKTVERPLESDDPGWTKTCRHQDQNQEPPNGCASTHIQERRENTINREMLLAVCADWPLLKKELRAEGVVELMKQLTDYNKLFRTLDVIGWNWRKYTEPPRKIFGLIIHHYEKGILAEPGYKAYEERHLPRAKPLIEVDQPELDLDAPTEFMTVWEDLSHEAQTFFRKERPRIHESIDSQGGRRLIVECDMKSAVSHLNSNLRDSIQSALSGRYDSIMAMDSCEYVNYAKQR